MESNVALTSSLLLGVTTIAYGLDDRSQTTITARYVHSAYDNLAFTCGTIDDDNDNELRSMLLSTFVY